MITTNWFVSAVIASCMGCCLTSFRQTVILTSQSPWIFLWNGSSQKCCCIPHAKHSLLPLVQGWLLLEHVIVPLCFPSLHLIQNHWLQRIGRYWIRLADAISHDAKLWLSSFVYPVCKAATAYSRTNASAISEKLVGSFGSWHGAGPLCVQKYRRFAQR